MIKLRYGKYLLRVNKFVRSDISFLACKYIMFLVSIY